LAILFAPVLLAEEPRVETRPLEFRGTAPKPLPSGLREAVEDLPAADLKELLTILRENYVAPDKLDDLSVAKATALGLFERFAPGITLPLPNGGTPAEESPFRSEIIDQRIGYVRLGALADDRLAELDA